MVDSISALLVDASASDRKGAAWFYNRLSYAMPFKDYKPELNHSGVKARGSA